MSYLCRNCRNLYIPGTSPTPVPTRPEHPRIRAGLWAGGPQAWAGQAGPYPPGCPRAPRGTALVHQRDPAQTYLLTCRAQWLRPAFRPAVQTPLLFSPQPALQEDRGLLPSMLSQESQAQGGGAVTLSSKSQGTPARHGGTQHPSWRGPVRVRSAWACGYCAELAPGWGGGRRCPSPTRRGSVCVRPAFLGSLGPHPGIGFSSLAPLAAPSADPSSETPHPGSWSGQHGAWGHLLCLRGGGGGLGAAPSGRTLLSGPPHGPPDHTVQLYTPSFQTHPRCEPRQTPAPRDLVGDWS